MLRSALLGVQNAPFVNKIQLDKVLGGSLLEDFPLECLGARTYRVEHTMGVREHNMEAPYYWMHYVNEIV